MGVLSIEPSQITFADTCAAPNDGTSQVTPPTATVTITNTGNGDITNFSAVVDAPFKDIFVPIALTLQDGSAGDPAQIPQTLSGNASISITFKFVPKESGTATANLTVTGGNLAPNSPNPAKSLLTGKANALPPQPQMTMSCPPGTVGMLKKDSCALWPDNPAQLYFKETPYNTEVVWDVTFSNGGCPDLNLTDISITAQEGYEGTESAFRIVDGVTSLSVLGGAAPGHLKVAFRPTNDQGNYGWLNLKTNDPAHATVTIELKGYGAPPMCEIQTTEYCPGTYDGCCDFKVLPGTQGQHGETYNPCTGSFSIKNKNGSTPLTITSVKMRDGLAAFAIKTKPDAGTIVAGQAVLANAITVEYAPNPQLKSDFLQVETSLGNCAMELRGGSPPVIGSDPQGVLSFGELLPAGRKQFKVLAVKNVETYNQQLPLIVSDYTILNTEGQPDLQFYKVLDTGCTDEIAEAERFAKNTPIAVNDSRKICLQLDPSGGSQFIDTLRMTCNDPASPQYDVTLSGTTECALPPVAVVSIKTGTSCVTATCDANAGLFCMDSFCQQDESHNSVTLSEDPGYLLVTLSGGESYDLMPNPADRHTCDIHDKTQIVEYHWSVLPAMEDNFDRAATTDWDSKELTLKIKRTGTFEVRLKVVAEDGSFNASSSSQKKTIQVNAAP